MIELALISIKKRKFKGFHGYACLTLGTKFGVYFLH